MGSAVRTCRAVTSLSLLSLAALHAAWGAGSTWPARDRQALAARVAGTDDPPGPIACYAVASALALASGLVAGGGGARPTARLGRATVAAVLAARGVAGLTGATHRLVPWTPDADFDRLDRRYYGPLCLALAAGAAVALGGGRRPRPGAERPEGVA